MIDVHKFMEDQTKVLPFSADSFQYSYDDVISLLKDFQRLLQQCSVMRGQSPEPLPPDELLKYARLVISMSTDYSLGKIDAEHYVNVLGLAVESMRGGNGA